jgi:hypothetical protein
MAKINIITEEQHTPPTEGKLFITEDERIIIAFTGGERVITGTYLDTGLLVTIGVSMVSPVPSTWKIVLTNE